MSFNKLSRELHTGQVIFQYHKIALSIPSSLQKYFAPRGFVPKSSLSPESKSVGTICSIKGFALFGGDFVKPREWINKFKAYSFSDDNHLEQDYYDSHKERETSGK